MTGDQVLDRAYSHSLKEAPGGVTIDEETEGVDIVNATVTGLFLFGLRFNPAYFGTKTSPAGVAGVWTIPADALSVFHRETGGVYLHVVPIGQRTAAHPEPAVYQLGRTYVTAGNANDPAGVVAIDLWYCKRPVAIAALANAVDALLPDDFLELAGLECAVHLAIKDNRTEELPSLIRKRDEWAVRFGGFLETFSLGETRIHDRHAQVPGILPIRSVLAGGSLLADADAA